MKIDLVRIHGEACADECSREGAKPRFSHAEKNRDQNLVPALSWLVCPDKIRHAPICKPAKSAPVFIYFTTLTAYAVRRGRTVKSRN